MENDSNFKLINKSKHHTFLLCIIPGLIAFVALLGIGSPQNNPPVNSAANNIMKLIFEIAIPVYYIYLGYKFKKISKIIYKAFMVINILFGVLWFLSGLFESNVSTHPATVANTLFSNVFCLVIAIIQVINIILIIRYKTFSK